MSRAGRLNDCRQPKKENAMPLKTTFTCVVCGSVLIARMLCSHRHETAESHRLGDEGLSRPPLIAGYPDDDPHRTRGFLRVAFTPIPVTDDRAHLVPILEEAW